MPAFRILSLWEKEQPSSRQPHRVPQQLDILSWRSVLAEGCGQAAPRQTPFVQGGVIHLKRA